MILAGSALGLTASAQGRLLASAFYALGDARPPLYAALVRVMLGGITGVIVVFPLRDALGYSAAWGAFGVTAAAGVGAWIEYELLRRWLSARIGSVPVPVRLALGALGAAALAGALGYGAGYLAAELGANNWQAALVAIPVFGVVYLGVMAAAKVPETSGITRRLLRTRR
jgi:putative peptidoglycan lipid II flippase